MAQIQIQNLTFTYSGADDAAIKDITLKVEEGELVVICGESGCGKSTLLRSMKPAIRPFGQAEGKVLYNNEDIDTILDRRQACEIGFIMQDPEHQIVTDKVWHEMAFGLENLGYDREEIRIRVAEMAEYFGIVSWLPMPVEKLSGGQKQLLNLASVMTMHPKVMILDEPTSQLDPVAAENFLNIIRSINNDLGTTVILSEHRLNYVMDRADRVVVMKEGGVLLNDTGENVARAIDDEKLMELLPVPAQVYKRCEMKGVELCETGEDDSHATKKCERKSAIPLSIREGRQWINSVAPAGEINPENDRERLKSNPIEKNEASRGETGAHKKMPSFGKANIAESSTEIAVECKNLWFRYEKKGEDIIKGLNISAHKGEIFAIMGGNGTGKTTTLALLSGILKSYEGKIKINGSMSALPQNVQTLFKYETVRQEAEGVPEDILKEMGLEQVMENHPYDISGGQQQKLALAKVLAKGPDILLLDEPTKSIDNIYKKELGELMLSLKAQGKTIIMVSHDVDFCGEYADRCGLFAKGSLTAVNDSRRFFAGNSFYTTAVSKMAGHRIKNAIKKEDVVCYLTEGNIIS